MHSPGCAERTDRASVAGCGFREPHLAHTSIGSGDGRRCTENRGFSERCSAGCTNGRVAVGMETGISVRWPRRLGIRLAAHERPTAVLARNVVAILRQAGFAACQGDEASFVSHLSAHLWTLLNANGENSKVVQELLRHASLKVTTDVYMQAVSPQKREAQSKLVKMVLKKPASS